MSHHDTLAKLAKDATTISQRKRAQLLLLHLDGKPTREIAEAVELSPSTVRTWVRRYRADGLGIFPADVYARQVETKAAVEDDREKSVDKAQEMGEKSGESVKEAGEDSGKKSKKGKKDKDKKGKSKSKKGKKDKSKKKKGKKGKSKKKKGKKSKKDKGKSKSKKGKKKSGKGKGKKSKKGKKK